MVPRSGGAHDEGEGVVGGAVFLGGGASGGGDATVDVVVVGVAGSDAAVDVVVVGVRVGVECAWTVVVCVALYGSCQVVCMGVGCDGGDIGAGRVVNLFVGRAC